MDTMVILVREIILHITFKLVFYTIDYIVWTGIAIKFNEIEFLICKKTLTIPQNGKKCHRLWCNQAHFPYNCLYCLTWNSNRIQLNWDYIIKEKSDCSPFCNSNFNGVVISNSTSDWSEVFLLEHSVWASIAVSSSVCLEINWANWNRIYILKRNLYLWIC